MILEFILISDQLGHSEILISLYIYRYYVLSFIKKKQQQHSLSFKKRFYYILFFVICLYIDFYGTDLHIISMRSEIT